MAGRALPWAAARERREYLVRPLRDREEIRARLRRDGALAAYALAQLEPGLFERSRWYAAGGPHGEGLVTHSRGGLGDASYATGDPRAVAAILSIAPGPARGFLTCGERHLAAMRGVYRLSHTQPMLRMSVRRGAFRPREIAPVTPLLGIDIRRVNALYGAEGPPASYDPGHIDGGVYRGVVVGGRLVAIAGTHAVSPAEGVAVVGNVFTHPRYRGQGYATAAASAVTGALLERCATVVLTVDPANAPAVAAYRRLGYREAGRLVEANATRRDSAALLSPLRRLRARLRGRGTEGALVAVRA